MQMLLARARVGGEEAAATAVAATAAAVATTSASDRWPTVLEMSWTNAPLINNSQEINSPNDSLIWSAF